LEDVKNLINGMNLKENNYLVRKSNVLIMNTRSDLSHIQQKLIILLASKVKPEDQDFMRYKLVVKDYMDLLGIKDQSFYSEMPKITEDLFKKVIKIEDEDELIQCSWLSCAIYKKGSGEIELEFSPKLKPYMLELNQRYTQYEIKNILSLKDKHTIRIYEILKCYQYKKIFEISVEAFKRLLYIEDQYPLYGNFKTKVLKKAQKNLEKTDVNFDFEEIKTGRKVTDLRFIIHDMENVIPHEEDYIEVDSRVVYKVEELKDYFNGEFTDEQIEKILENANDNIDLIKEVYTYVTNDYETNNIVGAMLELVKPNKFNKPKGTQKTIKKKTKFHNFDETFTKYSEDELDEIIRKSQQEKFPIPQMNNEEIQEKNII
jgi:plasmid replication initiation protein